MKLSASFFTSGTSSKSGGASASSSSKKKVSVPATTTTTTSATPPRLQTHHTRSVEEPVEQSGARVSSTSAGERSRPVTPVMASANAAWSRKHRHSDSHLQSGVQQQAQGVQQQAQAQVVVGITASLDDEVEDWTEDFMDSTKSDGSRERQRTGDRVGDLTRRFSSNFHHASSALQRATVRWHRQHSLDSNYTNKRNSFKNNRNTRLRKSSGDMSSGDTTTQLVSASGVQMQQPDGTRKGFPLQSKFATVEETAKSESSAHSEKSESDVEELDGLAISAGIGGDDEGDDEDEDEDWDVEFGFAENSEDELMEPSIGSTGGMDATRRRSENFNIFLRNFHDMMDGDDLSEDEEDIQLAPKTKRQSKPADEQLFQRKRSDYQRHLSIDGSVDGAGRASLTSVSGSVEYTLADKYRILEVAGSSAYAVRIERYPKPCATYSSLEKDVGFASFSENKFERWLETFVSSKCDLAFQVMEKEREQMTNPRQQKNHQFRTLVSLPFGKEFVANFFKQVSLYRYFGEEKSNRELVRVFFEKVSTTAYSEEDWSLPLSTEDFEYIANCAMEILQEAARMYGPKPPASNWNSSSFSFSSTSSSQSQASSSATLFWMRQFQSILLICAEAFPKYRHVIALIELRYVSHHLVGFASGDFTYTWQICNQLPAFCPMEMIAGESAPNVANEILEYYGALFVHLNTSPDSRNSWQSESPPSEPATESTQTNELKSVSFGISSDVICLQALVLCDIQCLYESRSVLAEVSIPELVELFEFEDDDMNIDPRLMELLDTEVKVQTSIPGLYTGARAEETPRLPERRNSSGGLGGWSNEARLLSLLKPSSSSRISALGFFYDRIPTVTHPLVKAKCASVLGSMHILAGSLSNLRAAESLAYEAVRLLEACSSKKLEPFSKGIVDTAEALCVSMFNNDGLLSELGREALEQLGNVLIKNQKYRYGILVLEAAGSLFGFLNQGCEYEKMDRLLCRLTLEADDVQRALPLHEKVANSTQRQGNITEYVYLTQALTNLWIREGNFARAEENLLSAFRYLRDHTNVLPQSFLSCLYGSYSSSDAATSIRSGTMMTATSSTASSSISGSFHLSSRGSSNTSELDSWLNHDINLHLLVREIYRSSGRCLEGMQVLQHLLSYSSRLPRGKRTLVRMLLAEDSLKMNMLDTCRYMFNLLDQEGNLFCERLRENILSSTIGSSSGGGGGSSSGGGRSMGGLGSEARYCFDMVFSIRYITCRAKFYLKSEDYREAFAWLSLAHMKSDKENPRKQAQLHFLDGKALFGLFREFYESRRSEKASQPAHPASLAAEIERMITSYAGSFYGLTTMEKGVLEKRLTLFGECARSAETAMEQGVKSFWTSFDQYQSLDDSLHQLKSLLEIVNFSLAPVEQSFFALGSNLDDDMLKSYLSRGSAFKNSGAANPLQLDGSAADDDIIEKTRRSVFDAQKLLRKAMSLAEQVAEPACLLRTFIFCSEAWIWLERIASYKNDKMVKEAAAFWEEGVKLLKAVFLRRVAFHNTDDAARYRSLDAHGVLPAGHAGGGASGTFSVVPILNFSESVILKLENMTLQLIFIACQLQQFERVPEYVEEMLGVHLDELLSAKMCLSSISQQLSEFREHQRSSKRASQSSVTSVGSAPTLATPRSSGTVVSSDATTRAASFAGSGSTPSLHSSGGASSSTSSTVKRKGHKKNQSMSSISELLASGGSSTPSSSFHDISSSFSGSARGGSFLGSAATPRTGLASLNERGSAPHGKHQSVTGIHPPLVIRTHRGHHGFERTALRTRGRSRSAPQPIVPDPPSKLESSEVSHGGEPHELLTAVHESGDGEKTHRIVDLADVSSWCHDAFGAIDDEHESYGLHGEGSSSGGAIGLYDFDEVQSEKLWWIFNMWRDAKAKYTSGKIESSAFRTQNLRYLRTLLDTFDPHQVAVLYVNGHGSSSIIPSGSVSGKFTSTSNACGIVGFDVAHINSYALIQDNSSVLSIGYDLDKAAQLGYSQLKFKVFGVKEGETLCWRSEIPRPDWYLKHYDLIEAESAAAGAGALKTLRLFGPKVLVKLLGLLLLENALVITGSSFPQVQEVTLSLLKLLHPFQWQHTFLPFIPITSWRYLYDSLHLFSQAQLATRPKSRKSFSRLSADWRWGSSPASSLPNMVDAADGDEPPFLFGTTTETWQSSMMYARSRGDDIARTITAYVTVVDLDALDTFAIAKSSTNAVTLPRKWRKHFLERFDKVVKHRRKAQQKVSRRLARQSYVPSTPGAMSTASTPHGPLSPQHSEEAYRHLDMTHRSFDDVRSSRSATMWLSQGEAGSGSGGQIFVSSAVSSEAGSVDERLFYDSECYAAFIAGLHEFYDKLCSLCEEKDKKLKGSKKKGGGLSKRQELKAWFSSTHEFDPFVDKFQESEMYLQFEKEKALQFAAAATAAGAALSRRTNGVSSSSEASGVTGSTRGQLFALLSAGSSASGSTSQPTSGGPRSSQQLRSAGSMSSTSSGGVGVGT